MLKIITKKEQLEIEKIKKENDFFKRGYRAISAVLDYQRAIVSILETLNLKQIEIDNRLLYTTETEIQVSENIKNHSTIIRLVKKV